MQLTEKYVTDRQGNKIAVMLDIEEYHKILEALEELEAIKAVDQATLSDHDEIAFKERLRQAYLEQKEDPEFQESILELNI